jgi:hypothetical protein
MDLGWVFFTNTIIHLIIQGNRRSYSLRQELLNKAYFVAAVQRPVYLHSTHSISSRWHTPGENPHFQVRNVLPCRLIACFAFLRILGTLGRKAYVGQQGSTSAWLVKRSHYCCLHLSCITRVEIDAVILVSGWLRLWCHACVGTLPHHLKPTSTGLSLSAHFPKIVASSLLAAWLWSRCSVIDRYNGIWTFQSPRDSLRTVMASLSSVALRLSRLRAVFLFSYL